MLGLVNPLRLQDELFQDGISCELDLYQLGQGKLEGQRKNVRARKTKEPYFTKG